MLQPALLGSALEIDRSPINLWLVFFSSNTFKTNLRSKVMGKFWVVLTQLHSLAGPVLMLLYPLYASVIAMESETKLDDEQWLAYWIIYSFLTLLEILLQPVLEWIPVWYSLKLVVVAWLVLPQFRGAAFIYERFVREQIRSHGFGRSSPTAPADESRKSPSPNGKPRKKFVDFITQKKGEQEAY